MDLRILLVFAGLALTGLPAMSQFMDGPKTHMPNELIDIYTGTLKFQRLRANGAFNDFNKSQGSALQDEIKCLKCSATDQNTVQNPAVENAAVFRRQFDELLKKCPVEIADVIRNQKIKKDFRFSITSDVKSVAMCIRGFDVLYSGITHWNDLRRAAAANAIKDQDRADVRPYFTAIDQPTPSNLKTACLQLNDFMLPRKSTVDCSGALTIETLMRLYQTGLGVLTTNPAIHARREGEQTVLELWASASGDSLNWMQEVLDRSWNHVEGSQFKIRLVDHNRRGNAVRLLAAPAGTTPGTNGLASNEIYLDRSPDTELILIHEFGHILGFRDCYVQLWDQPARSTTYYELDKTNIMCSFSGQVSLSHTEELKRAYPVDLTPGNNGN